MIPYEERIKLTLVFEKVYYKETLKTEISNPRKEKVKMLSP